jgi:thiamine pyrophosphate-dependent acetolactate synthase large subunit-like protein
MVQGKKEKPDAFPQIITCPNEMVALSMADGYARLTNKPQCVIVHVDVGTQGMGAAVHNASCGRAPVLIFAGLSPFTLEGEMRGSRTEFIHWIQDVPDQKQIVAQYCRYTAEIKSGKNIKQMVNRALQFATSDPKGPVYLYGAREIMEQEIKPYKLQQAHWKPVEPTALPEKAIAHIADRLSKADEPLVITGYSGRSHHAPLRLRELTDLIPGLRVLDTGGSDMCFPGDHPAWLGLRYGVDESIRTADVILVLDCDVPWVNTQCHPKPEAEIFHIDVDPLKAQIPVFYLAAEARYKADALTALTQLTDHIKHNDYLSNLSKTSKYVERRQTLDKVFDERLATLSALAKPADDGTFGTSYLTATIRKLIPEDSIFAIEAVTNTLSVADQVRATNPGQWINCGGGGLGWSGGAALGIKLATKQQGRNAFVCQIVGDGTFLFSVPGSVYWISRRYGIPVLTIVLNNKGKSF